jgi:hypothetical protein
MTFDAMRRLIFVLALLLPVPVFAAGFTCAPAAEYAKEGALDETDEVAGNARETVSSPRQMQAWLKRLPGRYTYEGYVDMCGNGNAADRRPVKGKADCIAVSAAADVHCTVNVNWPPARKENGAPVRGGVSNLAPAQFLFSIEMPNDPYDPPFVYIRGEGANHWGIVFVQVDNNGMGEWASGVLVGDTFLSREPCVDIPGDCHKTTRITALPDSQEIFMSVEVTIDRQRVLRQAFTLEREPDLRTGK